MEESLEVDFILKYILVGDTSVGKSSILSTFTKNQFNKESNPTMGVQFATKKIEMNGKVIKLQVWDTAGQQSFRTITRAYYKNAIGVLLVYDLATPKTIENLESWLSEIEENSNDKVEIVIVGNKKDQYDGRDLILPEAINKFKRYQTSAKTGHNVSKVFSELTASILNKLQTGEITADGTHGVKRGNLIGKKLRLKEADGENDKSFCC